MALPFCLILIVALIPTAHHQINPWQTIPHFEIVVNFLDLEKVGSKIESRQSTLSVEEICSSTSQSAAELANLT